MVAMTQTTSSESERMSGKGPGGERVRGRGSETVKGGNRKRATGVRIESFYVLRLARVI